MIKPKDLLSRLFKSRQPGEAAGKREPVEAAAVRVGAGCPCGNAHVVMIDNDRNPIANGLITREEMPSFIAALCEAVGAKLRVSYVEPGEEPAGRKERLN